MSFNIINRTLLTKNNHFLNLIVSKRFILSSSYQCTEEWNKRLEEPLIKNIELDNFFYQLNEKLTKKVSIRPTDVDLFLNKASSKNLNEIINVIQRFRKNWRSRDMLESSHHAFIKLMLASDQQELNRLVEILSKRIEYGIFPDKFCYNLILDRLIELKQYENAAKVAVLRMLQEELESLIGNYLSLKAVNLYLKNSGDEMKTELFSEPKPIQEDDDVNEQEADEDEDEVEYIRVPYLRNPFFDDHFDIKETYSLIGKTFYLNGNAIKEHNKLLADNCILYGLILYKKWQKAFEFLNLNLNTIKLSEDLVELADQFISKQENVEDKATELLDKLKTCKNKSDKNLDQLIDDAVSTIHKLEETEINDLKKIYQEFAKEREIKMKQDLDDLLKLEIIEQIKEKKREFKEREKKLYFFENIEHFKLLEHEAKIKIKEAEEGMKIEEEYIPPKFKNVS